MPAKRQIRTLDQRIADAKRELEALEAKKRVREDKTLKAIASMERRLRALGHTPPLGEHSALLHSAAELLFTYLEAKTRKPETALPFEEPGS